MSETVETNSQKLTFYPMAGSVTEQFENLLHTLQWIDTAQPTSKEICEWLKAAFGLSHYFARDVYTVLLMSSGLVRVISGQCHLTSDGYAVLKTASPTLLLEVFERQFIGIVTVLEVLRAHNGIDAGTLSSAWFDIVKGRFPRVQNWSKRTLSNQCRHRINWLRAMNLISVTDKRYSLSADGWQLVLSSPPEAMTIQQHEIKKEEKQLRHLALGAFQPFASSSDKTRSLRATFVRDRAFRRIVTDQYEYHCAVCSFSLRTPRGSYACEAAHIILKHKVGSDDPRNGLCLCGVHHWAFDEGVISVRPDDLTVVVAAYLKELHGDVSTQCILELKDRRIRAVKEYDYTPSPEALAWHNQRIFLG